MNLKEICDSRHITGYQLIKKTGLPRMTIYNLLNGTVDFKNTSVENGIKIADVLGMTVEEVYEEICGGNKDERRIK